MSSTTALALAPDLVDALQSTLNVPVDYGYSGGGISTIYVGTPDEDGRYQVIVGPFRFDDGETCDTYGGRDVVYVGPDDDGMESPVSCFYTRAVVEATRLFLARSPGNPLTAVGE